MAKMPEGPPDEGEGWITSYADLMSLLACFFMLMMAFANYDPPGFQQKAKVIASSFTKEGGSTELDLEKLRNELAHHPDFEEKMKITLKDGELVIVFSGSALFPEGEYRLDNDTLAMVDTLIDLIRTNNSDYRILIEGHADKNEILVGGHMNHWALSSARSASVIARFEYFGFKTENMVAVGKGDSTPIAKIDEKKDSAVDKTKIAKFNRRVVIKVLEPRQKGKQVRMGLGVLFRDATGGGAAEDDAESLFKE